MERNLFSTPYEHAAVEVDTRSRPAMQLRFANESLITARMGMDDRREPAKLYCHEWAGPVYLPRRGHGVGKHFLASIAGETRNYQFDAGRDALTLEPIAQQPVIRWLVDSRFVAREWAVREAARHAKSKTFRRQ